MARAKKADCLTRAGLTEMHIRSRHALEDFQRQFDLLRWDIDRELDSRGFRRSSMFPSKVADAGFDCCKKLATRLRIELFEMIAEAKAAVSHSDLATLSELIREPTNKFWIYVEFRLAEIGRLLPLAQNGSPEVARRRRVEAILTRETVEAVYVAISKLSRANQQCKVDEGWVPYNHDRVQRYLGKDPERYKGQLAKLAKRFPLIRREATPADREKFGNKNLRWVYFPILIYEHTEGASKS